MIINLLTGPLLDRHAQGADHRRADQPGHGGLLQPVPELLYQSQSRSFGLLAESARFISKYGLEWLFPTSSWR